MSLKRKLRALLLCAALELGVLSGVPMRPDEIRELMNQMNRPKLAHVLPSEEKKGSGAKEKRSRAGPRVRRKPASKRL